MNKYNFVAKDESVQGTSASVEYVIANKSSAIAIT